MDLKSVQKFWALKFSSPNRLSFWSFQTVLWVENEKKNGLRLKHNLKKKKILKSDQWFILDNNIKKLYYMSFCGLDAFF